MAKAAGRHTERLSALIAEIEAEAYARGKADARKEALDLLAAGGAQSAGAKRTRGRGTREAASPRRRPARKRAPRGSVPRFVERVLREHPGSTVSEIPGHGADDIERSIGLGSIRAELRNGRIQGRYVSDDGRWSLAGAEASAGAAEEVAPAGPSPDAAPGEGEAAGGMPMESTAPAGSEPGEGEPEAASG